MSAQNALTPRIFLFRHGETEWAKLGRSTGTTEIALNSTGTAQVSSAAVMLVGPGKLLDPRRLKRIFVSPRKRARQTFELLLKPNFDLIEKKLTYTEDIAEWDYGDYEGLKIHEIRRLRQERGQDKETKWDIWTDGCEGGESRHQITERLDRLISQIKEIQQPYMHGEKPADVLLVAHGLILRCFTKRWIGLSIDNSLPIMFEPGAISVLSYKNNDVDEPALYIGLALPSEEDAQRRMEETPTIPIEPPIASGAYEVNGGVIKGA
ncbi:putative phosphoglycerate mutase [Bisporella sp. PMI_857]|nr:putative phosphoglycerate mutase [Bisporella sp. PMI_857]